MRFGNTAIVSVRGMTTHAHSAATVRRAAPNLTLITGGTARPAARVAHPGVVRTGRGPTQSPASKSVVKTGAVDQTNGANIAPCATGIDWNAQCDRPLSGNPNGASIAAGATTIFTITPCGPYRMDCLVGMESTALLFDVTQILVCRKNYLENGALPLEAFSDQGFYGCKFGCGSVAFPALPFQIGIRNNSLAAAVPRFVLMGQEASYCD
jgi:hypothetical protein